MFDDFRVLKVVPLLITFLVFLIYGTFKYSLLYVSVISAKQ